MNKTFKIKVNADIPNHVDGYPLRGRVVSVISDGDYWLTVSSPRKYIKKADAEVVEDFELKSGMTFVDAGGRTGLIVGTNEGLVAIWYTGKEATSYSPSIDLFFKNPTDQNSSYNFTEVFAGMNNHSMSGMPQYNTSNYNYRGKSLWKREPTTATLGLNSEYTAVISKEEVTVGCQKFPIKTIKEIIKIAEGL